MFSKTADFLARNFQKNNIITSEQYEICRFGLQQGMMIILNIVSTIIIGFVLKAFWYAILFMILFVPLRSNAGGIHAKTTARCYWYSVIWMIAVLWVVKNAEFNLYACIIPFSISSIIILIFSPIEDINKPLDDIERVVYRKRSFFLTLLEGVLFIISIIQCWKRVSLCITCVIGLIAMFLIAGKIKNCQMKKSNFVH